METFVHGLLKGIILLIQIQKIVFTPVTLPREALVRFCNSNLCIVTFLMFLNFLRTIQLVHITFLYKCSWYYTEVYLNKEIFLHTASPPLLGAILRYFGPHFGVCSSIIESCSHPPSLWNFVHVFCIILTINVLRKISHHAFLCLGHYAAYFGYIPQCLEKLKTFFWYFAWMSWYYCGGHYNKKCVWFPLALGIFGCFWPILYYVPQIVRNHVTFLSEFFRYVA